LNLMDLAATARSKVCGTCKEEHSIDNFPNDKRYPDGKSYRCKPCHSSYNKAYKQRKTEELKQYRLEKRYGLSTTEYQEMAEATPHCPICGSEEPLVIDHDHSTGKVRGLICQPCNKGLGFFRDNIESMKNAIAYLEQ